MMFTPNDVLVNIIMPVSRSKASGNKRFPTTGNANQPFATVYRF